MNSHKIIQTQIKASTQTNHKRIKTQTKVHQGNYMQQLTMIHNDTEHDATIRNSKQQDETT